jgi:putative transcriptional regulator
MDNSLTEYRDEFGVSQRELAEHIQVTRQPINAVERDRYDPSVELLFKLAAFFECPVEELFHPDIEVDTTAQEAST